MVKQLCLEPFFTHGPFRCYRGSNISLIVSGAGKVNMAAAVGYLHALGGGKPDQGWLNVGIAGHRNLEIGYGTLVRSIRDATSGRIWQPKSLSASKLPGIDLVSLDRPTTSYDGDPAYDMEASAFVEVATRCTAEDVIQCYKIISDNFSRGTNRVSAKLVEQLVYKRLDDIEDLLRLIGK